VSEEVGWGLFASRSFKKGEFLAPYTGVVLPVTLSRLPFSPYTLRWNVFGVLSQSFVIDAEKFGNEARFMNHAAQPNVELIGAYDRGIVHPVLVTRDDVSEGAELLFDYGDDYWRNKFLSG
jgi:SET domain-containing protein